ncbi:hypothetical protein OF83DRAFT_1161384 [Amylostereum chailletii]|nr:hypothetical protein OF83DRAFT_1161384 [Amylostereum chailletii]
MSAPVAPPTPQEVLRKLSIHSAKPKITGPGIVSGTESDSDSVFIPDYIAPASASVSASGPLSAIAEQRSRSGEDSEDEDDGEDGAWRRENAAHRDGEVDIKSGYLWKKGERRPKNWKRRWFVLRSAHLAYYKTSAEYQLHRLLDLADVHACTPVALKRHEHACGLVTASRTYYLHAETQEELLAWVAAIKTAKETLLATATRSPGTSPIAIPPARGGGSGSGPQRIVVTPSPPHGAMTSSESEDASPSTQRVFGSARPRPLSTSPQGLASPTSNAGAGSAPPLTPSLGGAGQDASKAVVSGYLMKCGSKRRNWRKRWFVLNGEKLMYSGSHMDTKPHRQIPLTRVLDAFEHDVPAGPSSSGAGGSEDESGAGTHTFKIVTMERTLLLCAPSEEEEIRWVSAVRALIARREEGKEKEKEKEKLGQAGTLSGRTKKEGGTTGRRTLALAAFGQMPRQFGYEGAPTDMRLRSSSFRLRATTSRGVDGRGWG